MPKSVVPAFATEAEEANWWYEHREQIAEEMIEALRVEGNGIGTRGRLQQIRERSQAREAEAAAASNSSASQDVLATAK